MSSDDDGAASRALRVGLVCPEVPGHLNAMSSLGFELRDRGHTAVLVGGRGTRDYATARDIELALVGVGGDRDRELAERVRRVGSENRFRHGRDLFAAIRYQTKILLDELPDVIERHDLDGLIVDALTPGAALAADAADVPYVVAHAAFLSSPAGSGVFGDGLTGRLAAMGVRGVAAAAGRVSRRLPAPVAAARPGLLILDLEPGLARISQQPEWFAEERDDLPDYFHHTGPWTRPTPGGGRGDFDWAALDDDLPLVYVSMGTVFNRRPRVFEAALAAVADLPVQAVLTRGGGAVELPPVVPDNVVIADFVPQLELLDRAAACVNHAGLSTVFECIERDVPMLCLPSSGESRAIAARVDALGLGRVLGGDASAAEIRSGLRHLLEDPEPRRIARNWGGRMRAVDGVAVAIDVAEEAIRTGERVRR